LDHMRLKDVDFTGGYFHNTTFWHAELHNVFFEDTGCPKADFTDAEVQGFFSTREMTWKNSPLRPSNPIVFRSTPSRLYTTFGNKIIIVDPIHQQKETIIELENKFSNEQLIALSVTEDQSLIVCGSKNTL